MLKNKLGKVLAIAACGAFVAFGAFALTACGGASSDEGAQPAEYKLIEDGKLTVITCADYPPFENLEDGEIDGFDAALIREVGNRLGLEVNISSQSFDSLITAVAGGSAADVAISAITIDDERAKDVDFTESYYDSNQAVVVMADSAYKAKEDLNGEPVGAQSGTSGEAWVKENLKDSKYTPYSETPELLQALRTGKVNAAVYDDPVAQAHVAGEYKDLKVLETIATGEQYGIAVNKDNKALTEAINGALAEMKSDGTYDKILNDYLA